MRGFHARVGRNSTLCVFVRLCFEGTSLGLGKPNGNYCFGGPGGSPFADKPICTHRTAVSNLLACVQTLGASEQRPKAVGERQTSRSSRKRFPQTRSETLLECLDGACKRAAREKSVDCAKVCISLVCTGGGGISAEAPQKAWVQDPRGGPFCALCLYRKVVFFELGPGTWRATLVLTSCGFRAGAATACLVYDSRAY